MTTEELLIKRYKVESPFPTMERYNIKVGDILTDDGVNAVRNQNYDAIFAFEWESFPLIFRELFWYEERDVNDMPKYLKVQRVYDTEPTVVYKIGKEVVYNYVDNELIGLIFSGGGGSLFTPSITPASETEYLTYINTTQR